MNRVAETLRMFWGLALPYFRSEERVRACLLLAAVVAAELGLVYVAVLVTQWNARFFNALEARNWVAFQNELVTFCFIAVGAIVVGMSQYYFGGNDAQKTMGIIAVLLYSQGYLGSTFYVPLWVVLTCQAAIAIGTMAGGWRIVKTMGSKITRLTPMQGFCAETGGSIMLFTATELGVPVSTTHTITGCIIGVGADDLGGAGVVGVGGERGDVEHEADDHGDAGDGVEREQFAPHTVCLDPLMCTQHAGGRVDRVVRWQEHCSQFERPQAAGTRGEHRLDADALLVAPGAPERSVLMQRVLRLGQGGMPPLAKSIVDEPAVKMLGEWIRELK
mgnify:CR=1 FL=1